MSDLAPSNAALWRQLSDERDALRARVAELERELEQERRRVVEPALVTERQRHRAERAEAAAAQMRAALERAQAVWTPGLGREPVMKSDWDWALRDIGAALATDAGRALLERVERYERLLENAAKDLPWLRAALSEGK